MHDKGRYKIGYRVDILEYQISQGDAIYPRIFCMEIQYFRGLRGV